MSNFWVVQQVGPRLLRVNDAERGIQAGWINARGDIASPFSISGDSVAFSVKLDNGDLMGCVHKLPSGQLVNQYIV